MLVRCLPHAAVCYCRSTSCIGCYYWYPLLLPLQKMGLLLGATTMLPLQEPLAPMPQVVLFAVLMYIWGC